MARTIVMRIVYFQQMLDLAPHLDGKEVVAHGICYDGTLVVLTLDSAAKKQMFASPAEVANPIDRFEQQYAMTFLRFESELVQKVELPPMTGIFPKVQSFPNNSILVSVV